MVLICHVISEGHMIKVLQDVLARKVRLPRKVTNPANFDDHRHCAIGDIVFLIKVQGDFVGGIPSWAVTTLSPLVATDLVSVEKCFWWLKSKISRSRLNPRLMFISKAHGMLYSYTENLQEKEH